MPNPLFNKGETVVRRATNELGRVEEEPEREAGEYWYRIRFNNRTEQLVEESLDFVATDEETVESLALGGSWGDMRAVRCALGIERILNKNRSTVYAFQSQRILFHPYQYKPLLKILDSPDRRLLVADEVGLGKTIEAALVKTELEARRPLASILIVCPSRLREKWRNELNRKFDADFEIYDKESLLQVFRLAVDKPGRVRIRAIVSSQTMRGKELRSVLLDELGNVDLVIIDEAHHARNRATATSELLRELCRVSQCVLLLTATPVQLSNEDLFTLLNALRPTEFRDFHSFDNLLNRHAPIHRAGALARRQSAEFLPEIANVLKAVFINGRVADNQDPKALQVINEIEVNPPHDRRGWVDLERQIQDLHPLATIVTRTRKKDVLENAPAREARTIQCDVTPEEEYIYERLTSSANSRGWPRSTLTFGQVQKARQAASCLPAAFESQILGASDDGAVELSDILPSEVNCDANSTPDTFTPGKWTGPDSKFTAFQTILNHIWENEPDAKVLVFTFFKGTARYLEDRLTSSGVETLRIDGDVKSDPRHPENDERGQRISNFRTEPKYKVMVSTEVGSEGLDFQFCHHLVNYDLPWNPMVVEQRIGRIDRFGQRSNKVFIHNLVIRGTVEDRILDRLYRRIGIFQSSIGALDAILGDTVQELQREFVSGELTPEQADARVEQAANVIENRKNELAVLDRQAADFFGLEEYVREEMNRVRRLGRYVSEQSILAILETYLATFHTNIKLKPDSEGVFGLRLNEDLRMDIQQTTRGGSPWVARTDDGVFRFTTKGELAFESPELELVNTHHPLLQAAVNKLRPQMEAARARAGAAVLRHSDCGDQRIAQGMYFVVVFAQDIKSIRQRRVLEMVVWDQEEGNLLEPEAGERLLFLTVQHGVSWYGDPPPKMPGDIWRLITTEARHRNRRLREEENRENQALYLRRLNALRAEHDYNLRTMHQRLETNRQRGAFRILPAIQGQIDKEIARFRHATQELDSLQDVSAPLSSPIAVCVIKVVK